MNQWALFWGIVVLYSTISFSYMSCKILYKSVAELKDMFKLLENRHNQHEGKLDEKNAVGQNKNAIHTFYVSLCLGDVFSSISTGHTG